MSPPLPSVAMRDVTARDLARASPTRLRVLALALERPRTLSEIARRVGINKSAVHRHLSRLVGVGALARSAAGKWVYYRPGPAAPERAAVLAAPCLGAFGAPVREDARELPARHHPAPSGTG